MKLRNNRKQLWYFSKIIYDLYKKKVEKFDIAYLELVGYMIS